MPPEKTEEFETNKIRCNSAAFPEGGFVGPGSMGYTGYVRGMSCEFRDSDDDIIYRSGKKADFADGPEDMNARIRIRDVPEDTFVSIGELRTTLSSETGWNCDVTEYTSRTNGEREEVTCRAN